MSIGLISERGLLRPHEAHAMLRGPSKMDHVPHSSSGPGHRPLKAEITGSNPVCGTNTKFSDAPGPRPGGVTLSLWKRRWTNWWTEHLPAGPARPYNPPIVDGAPPKRPPLTDEE